MVKKKVGIVMDEDLHARMKSIAATKMKRVEDVYREAVTCWLKDQEGKQPENETVLSDTPLTDEEADYIRCLLVILRGPDAAFPPRHNQTSRPTPPQSEKERRLQVLREWLAAIQRMIEAEERDAAAPPVE